MEREFTVDIESFGTMNEEASPNPISCAKLEDTEPAKLSNGSSNVDWSAKGGKLENLGGKAENGNNVSAENLQVLIEIEKNVVLDPLEKKIKKDKRKSMSAKKHPKPPRPPRGLSLDAGDQKLIKELAELALIKRARIERMKALKKMKAAKGSSVSSASGGSFLAILLTVLFCVVIVCQGMSSRVNSAPSLSSSLVSPEAVENSFIAVEKHMILSHTHNDSNSILQDPLE